MPSTFPEPPPSVFLPSDLLPVASSAVSAASSRRAFARYRLVGDVDFKAAKEVAAKITPVGDD